MQGPPGVGKTLLAKAIAGESGLEFISAPGPSFINGIIGQGAQRIRDVFKMAEDLQKPCIIFIDEIDCIGKKRFSFGSNIEEVLTINQLLIEMDGFKEYSNIFVMAATNQADQLDPALLRPGRFDTLMSLRLPSIKSRKEIFHFYLDKTKHAADINIDTLSKMTAGFSPADISNLINVSGLSALRAGSKEIKYLHIMQAYERIMLGNKSDIMMSTKDRLITAYHESGHAILATILPGLPKVSKITIIPRMNALGVTLLEQEEQISIDRKTTMNRIVMLLGGRICEEMIFGEQSVTGGASDDIRKATKLAKAAVKSWGLGDVGPINYVQEQGYYPEHSEITHAKIDNEVQSMIHHAHQIGISILKANIDVLHKMAAALMEQETIDSADILDFINKTN